MFQKKTVEGENVDQERKLLKMQTDNIFRLISMSKLNSLIQVPFKTSN